MEVQPIPPIVVIEGDDFMIYESVDALVADLEPWFPSGVEYRAFDCEVVRSNSGPTLQFGSGGS